MKGKDFEKQCWERIKSLNREGLMDGGRYGVQVSVVGTKPNGAPEVVTVPSLPDFEGVLPGGRQWISDAKVCSAASFPLNKYVVIGTEKAGPRARQLKHLLARSRMGCVTFLLLHWNERSTKTKTLPPATYAFPVKDGMDFWEEVMRQERKSITREDCEELGVVVAWDVFKRERTPRPDILGAILLLTEMFDNG